MPDISVIAATTEATLRELANQSLGLATGLQNIAPSNLMAKPNYTVEYLLKVTDVLTEAADGCNRLVASPKPRI